MHNVKLKLFATAYNASAQMQSWAIGIGSKWIGSVNRSDGAFIGKVGPAIAGGQSPEEAARRVWEAFCDWQGDHPPAKPVGRVTLRTVARETFDVHVDDVKRGTVRQVEGGRYQASFDHIERVGACPMSAARLGWLQEKGILP